MKGVYFTQGSCVLSMLCLRVKISSINVRSYSQVHSLIQSCFAGLNSLGMKGALMFFLLSE